MLGLTERKGSKWNIHACMIKLCALEQLNCELDLQGGSRGGLEGISVVDKIVEVILLLQNDWWL